MKRLGFIVNPIAGLGGPAGFRGTDAPGIVEKALELGVVPTSAERGGRALSKLTSLRTIEVLCPPAPMGCQVASHVLLSHEIKTLDMTLPERTSAEHTIVASSMLIELGVDLILFVGGDGTARDVMDVVGKSIPALGVPAGVKVFSAVFGITPEDSGLITRHYFDEGLPVRLAEVLDVDEEAYMRDELKIRLYGYLRIPYEGSHLQAAKQPSSLAGDEDVQRRSIAKYIMEELKDGVLYVLGPGLTVSEIARQLGINKTLLGVAVILNGGLIAKDVNEVVLREIVERYDLPVKVIISPLGGSGLLLGRGNQQIGESMLEKIGPEDLIVVATPTKLSGMDSLKVDLSESLNRKFRRYQRITTGYREETFVRVR